MCANGHVFGKSWTLVVQNFKIKNRCQIEILKKQLTTKAKLLPNTCYVRLWVLKTDFIMKILLNNGEEIICKSIEFISKEVEVTLFDNTIRYFDRVDLVSIIESNESIELLDGLVSDVGNLLCDVADLDFEWQQAGYYETAKVFLKTLQDDNESMNFHECSECNIRCNCTTSECSCSCRTEL